MNKVLLAALFVAVTASATFADRGDRYRGGSDYRSSYDRGERYENRSRSSWSIGFGFSTGGSRGLSYGSVSYGRGYDYSPRPYYPSPAYCPAPVYCPPPSACAPPYAVYPTYYRPAPAVVYERPCYDAPVVVERTVYYTAPATVIYAQPAYVTAPVVYDRPIYCAPPAATYYYSGSYSSGSCGGGYQTRATVYYYGR